MVRVIKILGWEMPMGVRQLISLQLNHPERLGLMEKS